MSVRTTSTISEIIFGLFIFYSFNIPITVLPPIPPLNLLTSPPVYPHPLSQKVSPPMGSQQTLAH